MHGERDHETADKRLRVILSQIVELVLCFQQFPVKSSKKVVFSYFIDIN